MITPNRDPQMCDIKSTAALFTMPCVFCLNLGAGWWGKETWTIGDQHISPIYTNNAKWNQIQEGN